MSSAKWRLFRLGLNELSNIDENGPNHDLQSTTKHNQEQNVCTINNQESNKVSHGSLILMFRFIILLVCLSVTSNI